MAPSAAILSDDEIAAYRRDGVLVPRFRLSADDTALLQSLTQRLVADNPHVGDKPFTSPHLPEYSIQNLKTGPGWREIATAPAILDMLEQIMGPDIILWGTAVFHKRAQKGPSTPWHRDAHYWPLNPIATTTVWIAASPSRIENGCLRCVPGSHAAKKFGRHVATSGENQIFPISIADDEFDESTARDVELEPGQMVLFDAFTIHGAAPNSGTIPRAGYSIRYMPGTSVFQHDIPPLAAGEFTFNEYQNRPLILARGMDRTGRNDFSRGWKTKGAA